MTNYFDKQGNYINCENLSLAEIYHRAFALGVESVAIDKRPQGECRTCTHRDPEDKKCDCGALERQGCPFPVSDDYFCKFYERCDAE
jgi:hypothetical protein